MFFRLTPVVKNLLIVNIGIFVLSNLFGDFIIELGSSYYFESPFFRPFQLFTYMFLHASFMHLFSNMLGLFFFGPQLEEHWGSQRFIVFYVIVGIGAGLFYHGIQAVRNVPIKNDIAAFMDDPSPDRFYEIINEYDQYNFNNSNRLYEYYYENPDDHGILIEVKQRIQLIYSFMINVPMLGASGAIYGILMAMGLLYPNRQVYLLFPPIPLKMITLVTIWGGFSLYNGIFQTVGDNTAHLAHLGGMVVALLLIKFSKRF